MSIEKILFVKHALYVSGRPKISPFGAIVKKKKEIYAGGHRVKLLLSFEKKNIKF